MEESLKERIDRFERKIDRLERELAELKHNGIYAPNATGGDVLNYKEPEKWEPEGGGYVIDCDGIIHNGWHPDKDTSAFGTERPTRELAEKARDAMRIHNRALAYVQEHAPDEDGLWWVFWDGTEREYKTDLYPGSSGCSPPIGAVTGPKWVMQKLADDLNSGRVEL